MTSSGQIDSPRDEDLGEGVACQMKMEFVAADLLDCVEHEVLAVHLHCISTA